MDRYNGVLQVNPMTRVRQHPTQDEPLVFERSSPGKIGYQLPALDVPAVDPVEALGSECLRESIAGFPEVSEVEVVRHFTRLSTWNYAIDLGLYPLGSCTMKYNPRLNEAVARIEGIVDAHPYQPECIAQGLLCIQRTLESYLADIAGMDAVTLQPAAGAHGELTGLLMIRSYLESQGSARKVVLIPDSAHGTNPATAAIAGYETKEIPSNREGMIDLAALRHATDDSVAALMVTNPNTVGIFEREIAEVAEILHSQGALLYVDGANMNALVGIARPGDSGADVMHLNLHKTFSTPHGGGGAGSGTCGGQSPSRTVSSRSENPGGIRGSALRLGPSAVDWPGTRVLWQFRSTCARAGLHSGARRGRAAQCHSRRGPERQLHPPGLGGSL